MTETPGNAHHNNFGALRLVLAYAVIVSHSPEMLDGNPSREPLMALGLHVTFGGLAVYGFFIISGYLIASSYLSSRSISKFLISRILRIYPAFLVASLICIFIVGPFAGGLLNAVKPRGWLVVLEKLLTLASPDLPGAFRTLPIPALDGSMWTIRYEFRCYLVLAFLGGVGLLDRRRLILLLTVTLYAMATLISLLNGPVIQRGLLHQVTYGGLGDPKWALILTGIFMSGVCARLYRDKMRFHPFALILSLFTVFAAALLKSPIPELAVGTAGAYLLLWTAICLKSRLLQRLNNNYDLSYGVYLYAWPIASLVMMGAQWYRLSVAPILLTCTVAAMATLAGATSWFFIERPMLMLKARRPILLPAGTP